MNKIDLNHFRQLLESQGRDIENTINSMKENNTARQGESYPTELSNYDNHPADMGTQLYELEHNNALFQHQEYLLREIHDAIGRIEDGRYGVCVACGKDISAERLEALPYARLCIDCEENKEIQTEELKRMRPVEELVIDAPMGRKYLNSREDDEYEGIDQFNDLMKYGSADSPQDLGGYHDYEEFYTNEIDKQGIVDDMDQISNDDYRRQLPD
ncbi:MAG TPA: conjugal transfer protein TraR [Clostridiaceae bacterium]|nr:conjugal transfer protein TraR [Clostridiaceae bacterium]